MMASVALAVGNTITKSPLDDDLSDPKAKVTTAALEELAF